MKAHQNFLDIVCARTGVVIGSVAISYGTYYYIIPLLTQYTANNKPVGPRSPGGGVTPQICSEINSNSLLDKDMELYFNKMSGFIGPIFKHRGLQVRKNFGGELPFEEMDKLVEESLKLLYINQDKYIQWTGIPLENYDTLVVYVGEFVSQII